MSNVGTPWAVAGRFLVVCCLVAGPGVASGQERYAADDLSFLDPGTRIRVTTPNERLIGSYVMAVQDSLALQLPDSDRASVFEISSLARVEMSRGTSRGSSTLTLLGGLVGAAIGVAVASNEECDPDGLYGELCVWRWLVIPATFGAGGLIVGWGLGMAFVTSEKWQPINASTAYRAGGLAAPSRRSPASAFVGIKLHL